MNGSPTHRKRAPAAWIVATLGISTAGVVASAWPSGSQAPGDPEPRSETGARTPEQAVLRLLRTGGPGGVDHLPWSRFRRAEARFRGSREHSDGGLVLVAYIDVRPGDAGRGMRCRVEVLTHARDGAWHVTRVFYDASGCRGGGSPRRPANDTQAPPP